MRSLSLEAVAKSSGAEIRWPPGWMPSGARNTGPGQSKASPEIHPRITAVTIDSRSAQAGSLFVALRGQRVDGHDFVRGAMEAGSVAALVEPEAVPRLQADEKVTGPLLVVPSPLEGLQRLASWYRRQLDIRVVAITGTSGKTSTKDLTAAVVSCAYRCHATRGTQNNHIGLPLSLLSLEPDHQVAVLELGANHFGEVAMLAAWAHPEMGVITNIGDSHLSQFGDRQGVLRAKLELAREIPMDGEMILNADDPLLAGVVPTLSLRTTTFGTAEDADVRAEDIRLTPAGHAEFRLRVEKDSEQVILSLLGVHQVSNALAALAVGLRLGVDLGEAAHALRSVRPGRGRLCPLRWDGVTVIDDTHNANPPSTAVALRTASRIAGDKHRLMMVMGDMKELGEHSHAAHQRVGESIHAAGVASLWVMGDFADEIRDGAVSAGMAEDQVRVIASHREAAAGLKRTAQPGDVVLVKGSRAMHMERVVDLLLGEKEANSGTG